MNDLEPFRVTPTILEGVGLFLLGFARFAYPRASAIVRRLRV